VDGFGNFAGVGMIDLRRQRMGKELLQNLEGVPSQAHWWTARNGTLTQQRMDYISMAIVDSASS